MTDQSQSAREMVELAEACELYAKVHGSNIIVVENDWKPGDPERIEPRDTLRKAAAALRLAAQAAPGEPVAWREALAEALKSELRISSRADYRPWSQIERALATPAALPQDGRDPATIEGQPRVSDNDAGEITVAFKGKELRGFIYADDTTRRLKMLAAREYIEGWCDGRGA